MCLLNWLVAPFFFWIASNSFQPVEDLFINHLSLKTNPC